MSNEQPHINPWAEKLQQAPMPDADASWKGMERLLDQHMPVEEKIKKRRFFFIFFPILLFVIGVMLLGGYLYTTSQPQAKQNHQPTGKTADDLPASITRDNQPFPAPPARISKAAPSTEGAVSGTLSLDTATRQHTVAGGMQPEDSTAKKNTQLAGAKNSSSTETTSINSSPALKNRSASQKGKTVTTVSTSAARMTNGNRQLQSASDNNNTDAAKKGKANTPKGANRKTSKADVASTTDQRKSIQTNAAAVSRNMASISHPIAETGSMQQYTYALPSWHKSIDPLHKLIIKDSISIDQLHSLALTDSMLQAMKKKGAEVVRRGWTFGVGINHFLRVNNQQQAPYKGDATKPNSEGLTGKITDYLPVPQARYYFNNKLFVQGELQFNAPQFTQPVQLEHRSYSDGIFNVNDTAYLKKLTYFNLPLSIHYSPVKHFYIGAGVQFSRLNNAIVLYENTKAISGSSSPDSSIKTSKQALIKGDTLFQKLHTSEFRLLADASYQVGAISVGVRYNHALSNLVKLPVAGGNVTQTRNSSLQLYIRYRFLDKRKQVQPKPTSK